MTPPTPPRPIVWLIVLIVIMLAGVVSTLLTWRKDEPTGTPWFWTRLVFFPALTGCFAYGLRLHYYQAEMARLQAEEETLADKRADAIDFAREPLAVLGHAYFCALGDAAAAAKIVAREKRLEARRPSTGKVTVRHTSLKQFDSALLSSRYRSCFVQLLERLKDSLHRLPGGVPFEVYLQVPTNVEQDEVRLIWQACWAAAGHCSVKLSLLARDQGVMALDAWLDLDGGPALEKFELFVAAELHGIPPVNSAESAVALLFSWAPLAERNGLTSLASLHRPVEVALDPISDMVARTLLWGGAESAQVGDLWQGGLEHADKSALVQASSDLALGVSQTDDLTGIHDIDAAIGDPGAVAAWLAIALAVEHASQTGTPQLLASRQSTLRLAVVQPATETPGAG